ncbi:MAG: SurA N-terminal domain-containing protein [Elusimicrobiota bacterium]|jgi:hypothetical protein
MMNYFRKYRSQLFLFTVVIFLLGTFLGFGGYFWSPKGSPNDTVVNVDGEKVPLRLFYTQYERALEQLPPEKRSDEATRKQKKEEAIRDLVQGVVFDRLAKAYGIFVTDNQVINSLIQTPAFQTKGQFDPRLYFQALKFQLKTDPRDFEEEQRKSIAFYKLRWLIQSCIQVTEKEDEMAYALAHAGKMTGYEKGQAAFHDQLLQEKAVFVFNQWFTQIGQQTHVKVHTELLEGRPPS